MCAYSRGLQEETVTVDPSEWCIGGDRTDEGNPYLCCPCASPSSDESCQTVNDVGCTIPLVEIENPKVDDIPGFCCLDAPYQAKDWGETVSNEHLSC